MTFCALEVCLESFRSGGTSSILKNENHFIVQVIGISALYKHSEEVCMNLFFTNCVPILAYGLEVKECLARDLRSIHVELLMNDDIPKIFGWNRWRSIRELRNSFSYDDIYTMAEKRRGKFMSSMSDLNKGLLLFMKRFCDTF